MNHDDFHEPIEPTLAYKVGHGIGVFLAACFFVIVGTLVLAGIYWVVRVYG